MVMSVCSSALVRSEGKLPIGSTSLVSIMVHKMWEPTKAVGLHYNNVHKWNETIKDLQRIVSNAHCTR
ncbi:hypothetical protein CsSME_00017260 [Camellia sinensis var. sinensis]